MLVSISANGAQVHRWDVAKGHVIWNQANHAASTYVSAPVHDNVVLQSFRCKPR